MLALTLAVLVMSAGDPISEVKILGKANWPYALAKLSEKESVIRRAAELVAASPHFMKDDPAPNKTECKVLAEVTKALKVKEIDWKTQMLVVVRIDKCHPSYAARFTRMEVDKAKLTVHYSYWEPVAARECDKNPTPVNVAIMALVDRFESDVDFKGDARLPK